MQGHGGCLNVLGLRTEGEPLLDTLAPPLWRRETAPPESVVEGPLIQILQPLSVQGQWWKGL